MCVVYYGTLSTVIELWNEYQRCSQDIKLIQAQHKYTKIVRAFVQSREYLNNSFSKSMTFQCTGNSFMVVWHMAYKYLIQLLSLVLHVI